MPLSLADRLFFSIDDRFITGLLAFDQWFKVKKGSVIINAYEFRYWDEDPGPDGSVSDSEHTYFQMGALSAAQYEDGGSFLLGATKGRSCKPSGSTAISFTDADTDERVSFALLKVKAFREDRS